jgi:hypothetical protein
MDDFLSETKTTAGGFTGSKCGTYHEHETNAFHWHDRPVLQPWDVGKSKHIPVDAEHSCKDRELQTQENIV